VPPTETEQGVAPAAKQVAEHASTLARLELELAGLEVKRKIAALGVGIGLLVTAGLLGFFAIGFGFAAAAAALALALPTWAALLIVCGALVLLALILVLVGRTAIRRGSPPVPKQAIEEAWLTGEAIRNGR